MLTRSWTDGQLCDRLAAWTSYQGREAGAYCPLYKISVSSAMGRSQLKDEFNVRGEAYHKSFNNLRNRRIESTARIRTNKSIFQHPRLDIIHSSNFRTNKFSKYNRTVYSTNKFISHSTSLRRALKQSDSDNNKSQRNTHRHQPTTPNRNNNVILILILILFLHSQQYIHRWLVLRLRWIYSAPLRSIPVPDACQPQRLWTAGQIGTDWCLFLAVKYGLAFPTIWIDEFGYLMAV